MKKNVIQIKKSVNLKLEKEWDTFTKSIWDANQLMHVLITKRLTLIIKIHITHNVDQRKIWDTIIQYADNVAMIACVPSRQPGGTQLAERNGLMNKSINDRSLGCLDNKFIQSQYTLKAQSNHFR